MTGSRSIRDLPSALTRRDEISRRMRGRTPVVFLDYDGTLAPIAPRPELASMPPTTRQLVSELADAAPLAIISGRDMRDVAALVGLPGLVYAGSHGLEISGPGGLRLEHEEGLQCLPDLDAAQEALMRALGAVPGSQVERKRFSIAVHYRNVAPGDETQVVSTAARVLGAHPCLRRADGKKVIELRPDIDWDKGRAVDWILSALKPAGDPLPVYVGDDLTDEDAFATLEGRGLTAVVEGGDHPTHAEYSLSGHDEVERFLELLIRAASGPLST